MIIHVKQSFEIRGKNGEKFNARNGDIVVPPDWAISEEYFRMLCDSGKITVHIDSKTIELEQAKDEQVAKEIKKNKK